MMKSRPQKKTNGKNLVTTLSPHSDSVTNQLAFKYLKTVYPISRTNINGKFKRTIIVEDKLYSVSKDKNNFLQTLINNISNTFAISQLESKYLVFDYFKVRTYL
jgi:hypothetical protein